jgi:hypothetical protein
MSRLITMVELRGLEPLTFSLRRLRQVGSSDGRTATALAGEPTVGSRASRRCKERLARDSRW